jgi:large exoprotein involved in heme utilization and adhesion
LSAVNGGQLLTSTAGDGQAGDIIVNAREIQLSGSNSGLFAQTSSASEAGDLTLQPLGEGQTLTVNFFDGAQISASTQGSGRGGNLMITAPKSITLSGNGSLISAETSGSGTGGDLTLYTETLTVENQAKVTVSSTETGNAGNLNVTADSVLLDNGELIAQTASGEGGNINLDISDLLSMRHNSLISAQAGNNGNGGNIDIDAQLIVAIPGENSDIVADASKGNGGNINITTSGIFGLESRNQRTPLSDITASSELGLDGEVTITQPDVDPSQGLAQLPIDLVDATRLVERSCTAGQGSTGNSSFTVTGRGGLPPNLTEAMNSDAIEVGWIPLPPGDGKRLRTAVSTNPTPSMPRRIVEAQGLVKTPDGQVVLVAQAPDATPSSPWQKSPSCQGTQAFTN